jgi:hypothetical protein
MGTHKQTTVQRGLGWRHRQARENLLRNHVEGSLCWWDNEPMFKAQGLHADHSLPRSQGGTVPDRLLHSWCNEERGDGSRDHLRPALTGKRRKKDATDCGPLALRWP